MDVKLSQIPHSFHFPRLDWHSIRVWVEEHIDNAEQSDAWREIVIQWLETLNNALSDRYQIDAGTDVILFFSRNFEHGKSLLSFSQSGLAGIRKALGDVACEAWLGPLPILVFADSYDYHDYLSGASPDSEKIPSLGMCFRNAKDYVHVALAGYTWPELQKMIFHELTHACLSHLTLPLWLEEGVAQLAEEEAVPAWSRFSLEAAQAKELREFWCANGLREFWWESGFQAMDEIQSYSYQLAQVLFRLLLTDHRPKIADLLRHADAADAGDAAAREVLGISVDDLAAKFLGEGDWRPFPADGHGYWRRGAYHLGRDEYDLAISDFNEAAQLEPRFVEIFADRGLAHYQLGNYGAAISDYELALKIQWRHANALNNLAWLLATCTEDQFRNGTRAVKCATRACELAGYDVWYCVGTLAAALAESGDFDQAATMAADSLRLAPDYERSGCKDRLRCYRSGLPYREFERPPLRVSTLVATDISRRGEENVDR